MSRNLGALTLLDLSGPAWPVMGVLYNDWQILYSYAASRYDVTNVNIFVGKSEKKKRLCETNDRLVDMSPTQHM
jgi:hypothetical protein